MMCLMVRTREFDTEDAVAQAMDLFWAHGYEATSLQDLTSALGIGRGSLYAAFGSKEGLYQVALERYRQQCVRPMIEALSHGGLDVRSTIRDLFAVQIDDAVADERRRGCMVVNAAAERVPHDRATTETVRDVLDGNERALSEALATAQRRGELSPEKDPGALGAFLATLMTGLRIAAKTHPDRDALMRTVDVALTALD
jgi:TetR/AcrR family transcriptional regulator, transcriptional repressor for nem operon